jgi:uridine kinase
MSETPVFRSLARKDIHAKPCTRSLKLGRAVEIPNYSFVEHQRMKEKTYLYGANIVLLEGLL